MNRSDFLRSSNGLMKQNIITIPIRRDLKFGGNNCMLEPKIAMTLLLYDM